MTGYGRGECAGNGWKVTVEASSVNRKQMELSVNLPRNMDPLEAQVRDEVNRVIARGKVTLRVVLHAADEKSVTQVRLNEPLARAYARELNRLAKELKLTGGVSLELIARAPGVLEAGGDEMDASEYWTAVQKAVQQALTAMIKMREKEGAHLLKDLKARIESIRKAVARIQKQAPQVQIRYREALLERVQKAGLESLPMDEDRLMKEVVLFADRSDVSEELTRLQSHFGQFEDCTKSSDPVGRTLDFLTQEMNREINTVGSKANDSVISREVVFVKTELEKFREQVQNVE